MAVKLDHANLSVQDIDAEIRFLLTAFPEFCVRRDAIDSEGRRWVHVGNEGAYIALYQANLDAAPGGPYSGRPGLNHLGFEVPDVRSLRDRLRQGGYEESTVPNHHPSRRRVYFLDAEGNDWEFVEYLTDDPAQRHDYEVADLV